MTRFTAIRLVAMREVRERTRSRMFRISTAITIAIVVAAVVFPALAERNDSKPTVHVGIVDPAPPQLDDSIVQLGPSFGVDMVAFHFPDQETGEDALRNDQLSVLLVPGKELVTRVAVDPGVVNETTRVAAGVAETARLHAGLADAGLSPAAADAALNSPALAIRGLEPAPHRNSKNAAAASGGMIMLFVFLTLYGAFILNGVIEEKTSRVVEILLSTARPSELLIGEVLGIAAVGAFNGVLLAVAAFLARAATNDSGESVITLPVLGLTLLWFLLGFGMYSWMYACAGALVSRSEDAQNLVFPLQIPLLLSYGTGLVSVTQGPNTLLTVLSMIPLTAPMTMLERMAAQQVPLWQVLVSIGLCLLTVALVMRLAITIFAGGILRSGQRVKVRDAWRNPAT